MAKKKKGKVIRISESAWSVINGRNYDGQTTIQLIDNLIFEYEQLAEELASVLDSPTYYALLSEGRVFDSLDVARGEAIVSAVRKRRKPEEPVLVKVIA
jgi:hypothetical protein